MRKILLLSLLLTNVAFADTTYFSDGTTAMTQGNITYFSNGATAMTQGNTTYYSDGMTSTTY